MICEQCREAGGLLQNALAATGKLKEVLTAAVKGSHNKCTNPATCPCQHKIEKVMRT